MSNPANAAAQGPVGQGQSAPIDHGPLINAVNTMAKLEPGIVGLEANLAIVSAAVSLKRIADQLTMIASNTNSIHSMTYNSDRTREAIREVANAVLAKGVP
jgi:hypothetical protein